MSVLTCLLLSFVVVDFFLGKIIVSKGRQTFQVVSLEKDLFEIISKERAALEDPALFNAINKEFLTLQNNCAACHMESSLLKERKFFFNKLYNTVKKAGKMNLEVRKTLLELTYSVRYIHEHHIAHHKNLLRRGVFTLDYDEVKEFERSTIKAAPEIDIIEAAVSIQTALFDIGESFIGLQTGIGSRTEQKKSPT